MRHKLMEKLSDSAGGDSTAADSPDARAESECPAQDCGNITYHNEGLRKATHLFALVMPAAYVFLSKSMILWCLIPVTMGIVLCDTARLRGWSMWRLLEPLWGPLIRPQEASTYTGASYIMVATVLTVSLFSKPAAICALAFIIVGDSAGALVGRKWGTHKYGRRGKSIEGSAAFFLSSLIPVIAVAQMPFWIGICGASVATVTEALSDEIDDNLSVPLVSGLVLHLLLRIADTP
jgi:dolichol kinase